jgi:hypothetical protein
VRFLRYFILVVAATQAACEDPYGPRFWAAVPDTVELYSLSRAEFVGRPSAFDFVSLFSVPVEAPGVTGSWDVALVDEPGGLALVPAGAFAGFTSRAAIATMGPGQLVDVTEAPRDTAAYRLTAVTIQPNVVYVIRSRRGDCGFGSSGFRYAKVRAVTIDRAAGRLAFEYVRNPYCNDRSLVPPEN